MIGMDRHHDNDNEELSFITIGLAVRNVMTYLEPRKDRQKPAAGDKDQAPAKEIDKQREQQRFVETRLREIERMERRLRGEDRPRRKRN